jgi:AcrR family transcriptional regulator
MNISMTPPSPPVKTRRYDATRRRHEATRNRERVLDVAEEILLGQGYAETTVSAIARAADVSAELIYKSFGGKAGLVRAIQRRGLRGTGPVPAETRSDAISASELNAATIIREWATLATEVAPRVSPIMLLIRAAAANDHDLVELLEEIAAQRLKRMTHNAERLIRHPEVRPHLSVEQIRDILWTYSSPELYQLLVLQRGWTLTAYRDFLFHGMTAQLLNPDETAARRSPERPTRA